MSEYGSTVQQCLQREYVIVVGAEDYYDRAGNKMMFMAQAVRYVKNYASRFDLTTVLCFKGTKNTDAQLAALKNSVKTYGGEAKLVNFWSDVANHINTKESNGCQKRVQVLIFFAHGSPGRIWLSAQEGLYLQESNLGLIDASSFTPKNDKNPKYQYRHVTSWACQTANAGQPSSVNENLVGSLAQRMASAWDIEVRASITQTNYSKTWDGWRPWDVEKRQEIDGALWEPDGADGGVYSGNGSAQKNMPSGMYVLKPGQTSDYSTISLD